MRYKTGCSVCELGIEGGGEKKQRQKRQTDEQTVVSCSNDR